MFGPAADGGYRPVVAPEAPAQALAGLAATIDRAPKDATFLVGRGTSVVGVVAAKDGRALDVAASAPLVAQAVLDRATVPSTETPAPVALAVAVVAPALSTEEAQKAAPLMQRLSTWTTKFHRYEANGFGNNISIPTSDINGYVVQPGAIFDFWSALGPITYERGYRDGGAIINGRTEPTGALAGGICSVSTTLFNAAARAGLEILERANHYYYIDRYPMGLDATVWKTGGRDAEHALPQRHRVPAPHPGDDGSRLRPLRDLGAADGPHRDVHHADHQERRAGDRLGPVHDEHPRRDAEADRVPRERDAGLGDQDRPRRERRGHPR